MIGLLLFGMVMWVSESEALLGYTLGVALIAISVYVIIERVGPKE
jgi:hypothetical protein